MSLTLTESAKYSQDDLQKGVIETFVQKSVVLDRLPFIEVQGNSYAYNEEATLPGVAFRGVNSSYTESTGTVNQKTESLKILGGDADVDKFIIQTRSNREDVREAILTVKVKSLVYKFQDAFINGDSSVDSNSFDGLKKRLTGAQVISGATNGLPIIGSTDADKHAFFDKLDELIAAVPGGANALYMNSSTLMKIHSAARYLKLAIEPGVDGFGKTPMMYAGIPMYEIGQDAAGTEILPFTETQGTSDETASIYAVKFGMDPMEGAVTGLHNGGIMAKDLGEVQDKPVYRTRIEFYCGMGVFGGKAAARLKGILNS